MLVNKNCNNKILDIIMSIDNARRSFFISMINLTYYEPDKIKQKNYKSFFSTLRFIRITHHCVKKIKIERR